MTVDEELVKKARAAGAKLSEAERQVQLARAEYHTSVRRAHLAGGSLRELAEALELSHQRVQQIVGGAGGTWWQRVWRSRNVKRDTVCTFCERPPSEVAKLIAGPNVFICDGCVGLAERGQKPFEPGGPRAACSFCGKRRAADRPVLAGSNASLCRECLGLCRQILDGRGA
jgi:hypothetical protein